jgi:hypothetical protein
MQMTINNRALAIVTALKFENCSMFHFRSTVLYPVLFNYSFVGFF